MKRVLHSPVVRLRCLSRLFAYCSTRYEKCIELYACMYCIVICYFFTFIKKTIYNFISSIFFILFGNFCNRKIKKDINSMNLEYVTLSFSENKEILNKNHKCSMCNKLMFNPKYDICYKCFNKKFENPYEFSDSDSE